MITQELQSLVKIIGQRGRTIAATSFGFRPFSVSFDARKRQAIIGMK